MAFLKVDMSVVYNFTTQIGAAVQWEWPHTSYAMGISVRGIGVGGGGGVAATL